MIRDYPNRINAELQTLHCLRALVFGFLPSGGGGRISNVWPRERGTLKTIPADGKWGKGDEV
jgi:hypothetical protein